MKTSNSLIYNESGATIVYVAIILGVLVMFTALAIDVNHLYAVRNELQDAADAGALAGTGVLFNIDGTLNRDGALLEGARIAIANKTGNGQKVKICIQTSLFLIFLDKTASSLCSTATNADDAPPAMRIPTKLNANK